MFTINLAFCFWLRNLHYYERYLQCLNQISPQSNSTKKILLVIFTDFFETKMLVNLRKCQPEKWIGRVPAPSKSDLKFKLWRQLFVPLTKHSFGSDWGTEDSAQLHKFGGCEFESHHRVLGFSRLLSHLTFYRDHRVSLIRSLKEAHLYSWCEKLKNRIRTELSKPKLARRTTMLTC